MDFKKVEGTSSQGMQAASRSWKKVNFFFYLDLPKGMSTPWFKLRLILDFWLLEL